MTEPAPTQTANKPSPEPRGEMQPWSDLTGGSFGAGGPILTDLAIALVTSRPGNVALVGPHSLDLVRAVADIASQTTVFIRGVDDAALVAETCPTVRLVVGAIDSFGAEGPFDLVLALDGLDRTVSYDSAERSFAQSLRSLAALRAEDGVVALAHPHSLSPLSVLDARMPVDRYGDDEFWPIHDDPTRPADLSGLTDALKTAGLSPASQHLIFGTPAAPHAVVEAEALSALPDDHVQRLATKSAVLDRRPLLANPEEFIGHLLQAGQRALIAEGSLVVVGEASVPQVVDGVADLVVTADLAEDQGRLVLQVGAARRSDAQWPDAQATPATERDTAQPSETLRYVHSAPPRQNEVPAITVDSTQVAGHLPTGTSLEQAFLGAAAAVDLPAFRELASRVGNLLRELPVADRRVVVFDDLILDGASLTPALGGLSWTTTVGVDEALTVAYWRLHDALIDRHRRHPWPRHVVGAPLVQMWVEMSGGSAPDPTKARELADQLAALTRPQAAAVPDVRTALADAQEAMRTVGVAQGQIFGLERTIGFRDKQLQSREQVIRGLRANTVVAAAGVGEMNRLARRVSQVRSTTELKAGVQRVVRRAKRARETGK